MTKLYTVRATIEYVIAVDENNPTSDAIGCLREAISDIDPYDALLTIKNEILNKYEIPPGWTENAYPYRTDRKTPSTIGEILNVQS